MFDLMWKDVIVIKHFERVIDNSVRIWKEIDINPYKAKIIGKRIIKNGTYFYNAGVDNAKCSHNAKGVKSILVLKDYKSGPVRIPENGFVLIDEEMRKDIESREFFIKKLDGIKIEIMKREWIRVATVRMCEYPAIELDIFQIESRKIGWSDYKRTIERNEKFSWLSFSRKLHSKAVLINEYIIDGDIDARGSALLFARRNIKVITDGYYKDLIFRGIKPGK